MDRSSLAKTKSVATNWILYPAITGIMVGLGHFTAYYLSKLLMKQLWFINGLRFLTIEIEK
jgi:hypothetical protein